MHQMLEGCRTLRVDDHSLWPDAENDIDEPAEVIQELLQDALDSASPAEIPKGLAIALEAMGIGSIAGDASTLLNHDGRAGVRWNQLLRRYVGAALENTHSFLRPNRRLPHLVGVVPGTARHSCKPHIMVVIDTSASVAPELLEAFDAELRMLSRTHSVVVVQCDAQIQCVEKYAGLRVVHGRGGTDLRPPFEPKFLAQQHPDLAIYFTDGLGPAPTYPPKIPVIWCLPPGGRQPAAWGRSIVCGDAETNH